MAENTEMINTSSQESNVSLNESETSDRRKTISKCRVVRGLPRHPIQRHCPIRQVPVKRKKRCRLSSTDTSCSQDAACSSTLPNSCPQSEAGSSSSSTSTPTKKPKTATRRRKHAIDKPDGRGETALHKAAIKGDVQLVKSLLRKGANPNHQDYAGWTPLHEACMRGWYGVAQSLLKAGANANTPGLHNVTALHDATAWSHISLVKLLLQHGANLTSKTDKGETPVELASLPVLNYLETNGFIPERRASVVPERTDEMRKSTYRSKVVKANSADVTFRIKVRCEQKGEDRTAPKHNKKSKKKKSSRLGHSKKKMETEDPKKEPTPSAAPETKDGDETKPVPATAEETEPSASASSSTEPAEAESRRSSVSLDDEDEGKRNKRRKDKEEHARKDDTRKEEHNHKKEEHPTKKDDHLHKKEEHAGHKKEEHIPSSSRSKAGSITSASPKSTTSLDGAEIEDGMKSAGSPGPKVPPLKIVLPSAESEQGNRNGKNANRHHPYVVVSNDETPTAVSTVTTAPSSPAVQSTANKEEPPSPTSAANMTNEEQRTQQRVLRSTHSNRGAVSNSSSNGCSSGTNSSATSGSSSPVAQDLSPQQEATQPKEENKPKIESGSRAKTETCSKAKAETAVKVKSEPEEETKPSPAETRNTTLYHVKEEPSTVELHPRKRKLKSKPELSHSENEHITSFCSAPHPHEVPVTNCYQMFMDIRRQIDVKRKGLFPIQPKPPQGFKDYLMNRCTYTLAKNFMPRLKRRNADPPEGIPEGMKELYQEQESERYNLRMQHVVEKEKLVLSVEQEILRVHGRAARALANQALPFSACTILKDEEVYNVITPEQEEKDRNARSRYNGRLFISWLQDVDDKWEKIKEEMLARHHKEAESLNAIQKFNWDLKMRSLGLWKKKKFIPVEENFVPMLSVSDDFDLLPE